MSADIMRLASRVAYQDVRDYLRARGWSSVKSLRTYAAVFRSPQPDSMEVQIPLDRQLGDYAEAMVALAERVARVEGKERTQMAVLHDLRQPRRDVIRFGIESDETEAGSVGLADGLSLVIGVRKALLASACSALKPERAFHPRMTLSDAEAFVRSCSLGQTEVGSFVITVEAPHSVGTQIVSVAGDPFGRRATSHLLWSLGKLADALQADEVDGLLENHDGKPQITANLCAALTEIMPADESADVKVGATWSSIIPPPKDAPQFVRFDRAMYSRVEDLAARLRPSASAGESEFVGRVVELAGEADEVGRLQGVVVLQVHVEDELINARVFLNPDDYLVAGKAHLDQKYVRIHGVLKRGRRIHELADAHDFAWVE